MTSLAQGFTDWLSFSGDGGRGRTLTDACMAAAALTAAVDGAVGFAERATLDQVIDALVAKGAAELIEAGEAFDGFVAEIEANSSSGRRSALAALAEVDPEDAHIVLRVAEAIANAGGEPSAAVTSVVADVARALGLAAGQ